MPHRVQCRKRHRLEVLILLNYKEELIECDPTLAWRLLENCGWDIRWGQHPKAIQPLWLVGIRLTHIQGLLSSKLIRLYYYKITVHTSLALGGMRARTDGCGRWSTAKQSWLSWPALQDSATADCGYQACAWLARRATCNDHFGSSFLDYMRHNSMFLNFWSYSSSYSLLLIYVYEDP